jgi:hypothetical protein
MRIELTEKDAVWLRDLMYTQASTEHRNRVLVTLAEAIGEEVIGFCSSKGAYSKNRFHKAVRRAGVVEPRCHASVNQDALEVTTDIERYSPLDACVRCFSREERGKMLAQRYGGG